MCLANAKSISLSLSFSILLHSHSLPVLPQWASVKGVFAEAVSVCTANSEVPSSNMVLRESLSRPAGRYHFCLVELFLSISFPVDLTSSLGSIPS